MDVASLFPCYSPHSQSTRAQTPPLVSGRKLGSKGEYREVNTECQVLIILDKFDKM